MLYLSKEELQMLKEQYPSGTKVELVKMDDFQAPPVGTKGTVKFVDDTGTIHVSWETGGSLGVVYGEDECRKVTED